MTRPISPTDILCKDGKLFSVAMKCGAITVFATFRDDLRAASGLARFSTFHEPGDTCAEHTGMPVEIVRAYAKAHGGVAEVGAEALALLKSLPSQADPPMGAPATDSHARAVEAAPEAPLSEDGGAASPGAPSSEIAAGALDQHGVGSPPRIELDDLTPAVIEARRVVSECEDPLVWRKEWGRHRSDELPEEAVLWRRITCGRGLASRLIIVTAPRYASHPLLAEGVRLRERLLQIAADAMTERDARREAKTAYHQRLNGVQIPLSG